jgi:hypothetical protein
VINVEIHVKEFENNPRIFKFGRVPCIGEFITMPNENNTTHLSFVVISVTHSCYLSFGNTAYFASVLVEPVK